MCSTIACPNTFPFTLCNLVSTMIGDVHLPWSKLVNRVSRVQCLFQSSTIVTIVSCYHFIYVSVAIPDDSTDASRACKCYVLRNRTTYTASLTISGRASYQYYCVIATTSKIRTAIVRIFKTVNSNNNNNLESNS
jgi:hypothetical protein